MKKNLLLVLCLINLYVVSAQQIAVTETGEEVILYDDGTWMYRDEEELEELEIEMNPKKFQKSESSTFLLKSTKINVGIWLNPKTWSFKKQGVNEDAEFEFQQKSGDLYGMLISEKIEIPLETLKTIAIDNARIVSPDLKLVNEEYRMVNGLKVLHLQLEGTMQGIKFSYFGYYFSNANGTIQFVTFSSQNLMKESIPECEKLLNGLVELN